MQIIVKPRWKVDDVQVDGRYVIISITDPAPFGRPAVFAKKPGLLAVGQWEFVDVRTSDHSLSMRPRHAKGIWGFVDHWRQFVDTMVIHCEAGVSRSPSIAMAIADVLGIGRGCIDWMTVDGGTDGAAPNAHVYDTMRKVAAKVRTVAVA